MPFDEFQKMFNLGTTSTEQAHERTKLLSQVAKKDIPKAMKLLLDVDREVVVGLERFFPEIEKHAPVLADRLAKGGRVFFVGSGSSGRVGIDVAAKLIQAFPSFADQVRGVIAGGDSTMIKPREKFEDSEAAGKEALSKYDLHSSDTVVLISASGSATFNAGCGEFAADAKANVLYFYNSEEIPDRTKKLFNRPDKRITPLCIDIGAQAVAGSTRLQGATLAIACLGSLMVSALYRANGQAPKAEAYPELVRQNLLKSLELIQQHFTDMEKFCRLQAEIFSNPEANFRRDRDVSKIGYVTFVAVAEYMRTVLIDATEMPPTFSLNPMARENEGGQLAEYAAYLVGESDNRRAWEVLLGREVTPSDKEYAEQFLLGKEVEGRYSYTNRPTEEGNFVIGVAHHDQSRSLTPRLAGTLLGASKQGAKTGLILLCQDKLDLVNRGTYEKIYNALLCFEDVPTDEAHFSEALLLKLALNMISNMSMVLMKKVHGNLMIDVRASNKKLIDRCIRTVKAVWREQYGALPCTDEELYCNLAYIFEKQQKHSIRLSPVKIMLQMLAMKTNPSDFHEVVQRLRENNEEIVWG